ncbi:MAG: hypothetical protein GEU99_09015 [Luteitalea sp.]|nr:hypothetical protein [Luteitalea sp.]
MNTRLALLFAGGLSCLYASTVHAQAVSAGVMSVEDAPRHFIRTVTGDWETPIRRDDGTETTYTYVPPTKIEPEITVSIARDPTQATFIYQYELVNGPSAQQQLAKLDISYLNAAFVKALPPGWVNESTPADGRVILRGSLDGALPSGVGPGESLGGLVIEAPILPGIGKVESQGNTLGAVEIPRGLSNTQYHELVEITEKSEVEVPTMLPSIHIGLGEPELTLAVLLARIGGDYVSGFLDYQHPHAAALEQAFRGIYGIGDELGNPRLQEALSWVLEISQLPVENRWHQQMSAGLEVCVRAVLDGVVPDHRPYRPGELGER